MRTIKMTGTMAVAAALVWTAAPSQAAEIAAQSRIDRVVVYPDGATVTRVIELDLPAGASSLLTRDLPATADRSSVRVEGEGDAQIEVGSVEVTAPRPGDPTKAEETAIELVRDEIAEIDDRIAAATLRMKYLETRASASAKGEERSRDEDVKRVSEAIGEEAAAAARELREARIAKRGPERRLRALTSAVSARPPARLAVRINVGARNATHAVLRVSYSVQGAGWRPTYDAALTTGAKPTLRLTRRAEIEQGTGEEWSDVALSVSTLRIARGTAPASLPPLLVRYRQVRPAVGGIAPAMPGRQFGLQPGTLSAPSGGASFGESAVATLASPPAPVAMQDLQAATENVGLDVTYLVAGRSSVPSDRTVRTFSLSVADVAPDMVLEAVPETGEQAFVEASWKHAEDAPLLAGQVTLRRDGAFVGRGRMPANRREETVRLGFGADDNVTVKRDLVKRGGATPSGFSGLMASSKTDERNWTYTIHNGRDQAVKVRLLDRLPVAEADEIKVEELQTPQAPVENDVEGRRGVRAWTFEVKPRSDLKSSFGWRVSWPKDRDAAVE